MKGYKAFDKDMKCRGFQYEENKTFEEDIIPQLCNKGLHFCPMPLDVLNYYNLYNSEFAEVEALGKIDVGEDKVATNKLKIKSKISFSGLFKAHFNLVFKKITVSEKTQNTSGDEAHANTSGYKAHANTSGYKAHANTSGNYAHANTSGNYAHANTSGDEAHANTSGYKAHANTSGYKAISCSLGIQSKAKAINGWIVIVDWRKDKDYKWYIENIYNAKIGQKILDTEIQSNVWYWFEDGELKTDKVI